MTKEEYKAELKVIGQSAENKVITDTEFLINEKNVNTLLNSSESFLKLFSKAEFIESWRKIVS